MSTPRIRTIKPENWHDEAVCAVSRDARLLRDVLITFADDDGRWRHMPQAIIGFGYPEDEDVTPAKIKRWTGQLIDVGLVIVYTVDGKDYGCFPKWHAHQYVQKYRPSELPDCDDPRVVPRQSKDGKRPVAVPEQDGKKNGLTTVPVPEGDHPHARDRARGAASGSGLGSVPVVEVPATDDARAVGADPRLAETVAVLRTAPRLIFDIELAGVANVLAMYPPPADHLKAAHLAVSRVADANYRTTNAGRALEYAFADLAKRAPAPAPASARKNLSVYDRGAA